MNLRDESTYFTAWLRSQGNPSIFPNQFASIANIVDRLPNSDLISVMFSAEDDLAIEALKVLRNRFEDEMYCLEQMAAQNELENEDVSTDWG